MYTARSDELPPGLHPHDGMEDQRMHLLLTILVLLLASSPVLARDRVTGELLSMALTKVPAATAAETARVSGAELQLGRSLELPAADLAMVAGDTALLDEFELRLPEENLPESDIPLTLNSRVEYFIRFFQTRGRGAFSRWLSRSERYIPMMKEVLRKEGLPEDLVYLAMIESGFTPHAYSVASAVGPWQFMSGTGKRYALRIDDWIDERRDPLKSSVAAALYLKELYSLFNNDWYLAAAGYNAGENKILRAIDMYKSRDFWQLAQGSYLKRETKEYVPKLLAAAIIAKEPAKFGFADVAYLPALELDTVTIPSRTDLELVARLIDVPYQTLKELNPELRRWCTPPDYSDYQLKLPRGKKGQFEAEFANVAVDQRYSERLVYSKYRVKKKETLVAIARRYNTTPEALAELNHLKQGARLRGRQLLVPIQLAAAKPAAPAPETSAAAAGAAKDQATYYTVRKGDTLAALAKRFNVSATILSAWNNLKGKVALRPGKRLIVARSAAKDGGPTATPQDNS
jgi:peptidoglycan lytic transglycosylase D